MILKRLRKSMSISLTAAVLGSGALVGGSVKASDDLPISGYYEYDFTTQKESTFTVPVPAGSQSELTMEGSEGTESDIHTGDVTRQKAGSTSKKNPVSRWIYRNGYYYYYNSKGKLLKNGEYKVNGSYYWFDKLGRRCSGKRKDGLGFYSIYSTETGKRTSKYIYLKIRSVNAKWNSFTGYAYDASPLNRKHYQLSSKKARVLNVVGKPIRLSSIKKGDIVRVYTTANQVKETSPSSFDNVTTIKLLKQASAAKK